MLLLNRVFFLIRGMLHGRPVGVFVITSVSRYGGEGETGGGGRWKLRERGGKTASRESRNGSVRSESRCFAQGLTRPMKQSLRLAGTGFFFLKKNGLLGPIAFAVMRRCGPVCWPGPAGRRRERGRGDAVEEEDVWQWTGVSPWANESMPGIGTALTISLGCFGRKKKIPVSYHMRSRTQGQS